MRTVSYTITMIQARILAGVGLAWLVIGIYLGGDPGIIALRAAFAAILVMSISGALLRVGARCIHDRLEALEEQAEAPAPASSQA